MQTEPSNAAAPKHKRRFQFSLRTLLIGVTLLAVLCGYVGRQVEIVRERRAFLDRIVRVGGFYNNESRKVFGWVPEIYRRIPSPPPGHPTVSAIRSLLGDEAIRSVAIPLDAFLYDQVRAKFPDAAIYMIGP
ncbi:MAG TPA: hypothetical protein VG056_10745, partial [Pirellulales bacterium]|nr:hypothetical protein [Pirellulales bacterium]